MPSSRTLRWAARGLFAAGAAALSCRPASRPNVLLISVDTLRADRLGCYGHRLAETPAIDSLARDGVRFDRAYAPSPMTLPSHTTLLTGLMPPAHGQRDNGMTSSDLGAKTLAERLSEAGWETAGFVAAFVLNRAFGLDRGFGSFDDGPKEADAPDALDALFHATAPASERVDRVVEWLGRPREKPFFVFLHLYDVHTPRSPPPPFAVRFAASPYDGEVAYVDSQIARLLDLLRARGWEERTLVVVVSDHGEGLGEHGEETHGLLLHDATLRVPLLARWPGRLPKGVVRDENVSLADVTPTLLDLLGLPPAPVSHGRALFSDSERQEPERLLFAETLYPARAYGWAPIRSVRRGPEKFVDAPDPELYDLAADPGETRNRASDDARRTAALRRLAEATERSLSKARARGASPSEPEAEAAARLAALGYLARAGRPSEAGLDPKTGVRRLAGIETPFARLAAGDLSGAEESFRAELARFPESPELWTGLGRTLELLSRSEAADAAYREALARDPSHLTALARLVALAAGRGDVEARLAWARRLREAAPRHPAAQRKLAEALEAAGRRSPPP